MQSLVQRTPGLVDGTAGARSNKSFGKMSRKVPQCFMLAMSMFILSVDTVWHCGILCAIRLVGSYAAVLLSVDYSGPPSVVRLGSLARVCLVRPWSVSITFTWAKIHKRATKHWKLFFCEVGLNSRAHSSERNRLTGLGCKGWSFLFPLNSLVRTPQAPPFLGPSSNILTFLWPRTTRDPSSLVAGARRWICWISVERKIKKPGDR